MRHNYTREVRRLIFTARPSFFRHPIQWLRYMTQSYL